MKLELKHLLYVSFHNSNKKTVMYKEFKNKSGVYIIKNDINSKVYIGSSKCVYTRIKEHLKRLKSNTHENYFLQRHYLKYENSFYFEILCFCNVDEIIKKEQLYINLFKSYIRQKGFNINRFANSMTGFKHSSKTKNNWSKKRKGVKLSDKTKQNMSISKRGSKHSLSKLIESEVLEIRKNYDNTRDYSRRMSLKYNVSWHTVNYIIKRKTWKHI